MDYSYAVLDANNTVVNVVVWDGVAPYDPGEGLSLKLFDPLVMTFNPPEPATNE